MIEWDDYRFFLAVARCGTLKGAAKKLQVNQTTVGRRILALEESLGTQIFEKRSNGFFLTLAGQRILSTVQSAEESFLSVERVISGREEKVEGVVKLAMPGAVANHWLIPKLKELCERHPRLELQILTGPEVVNLARREADLAVRLVRPKQKEMRIKKIGQMELSLYGHSSLWKGRGKPRRHEDLSDLPWIGLYPHATSESEKSLLAKLGERPCRLRSAAWSSVYQGIRSGLGIGILPSFLGDKDSELERIHVVESVPVPLWLVVHPDVANSARVRAVTDSLLAIFTQSSGT